VTAISHQKKAIQSFEMNHLNDTSKSALSFALATGLFLLYRSRRQPRVKDSKPIRNDFSSEYEMTISSPGKVLIAGGYLILEKPNVGISVGTTSRFYTTIRYLPNEQKTGSESNQFLNIMVDSPQFQSVYRYRFEMKTLTLKRLSNSGNDFIEGCIMDTLLFIMEKIGMAQFTAFVSEIHSRNQMIGIKLRAHNDFYSQIKLLQKLKKPLMTASLLEIPPFSVPGLFSFLLFSTFQALIFFFIDESVSKTGLGSSAALTTSLVASILTFFNIIQLNPGLSAADSSLVHNLSQLVHCKAQGKIGSGFDVATAIYGTIVYARFSQDGLDPYFKKMADEHRPLTAQENGKHIFEIVNNSAIWDQQVIQFSLPKSIQLILGDVCGGSSSSVMVREKEKALLK
jgi:phosphomevalonate kinase